MSCKAKASPACASLDRDRKLGRGGRTWRKALEGPGRFCRRGFQGTLDMAFKV